VASINDDHGPGSVKLRAGADADHRAERGHHRTKRRLITYDEIPQNLVQAVVAMRTAVFLSTGRGLHPHAGRDAQRSDAGTQVD